VVIKPGKSQGNVYMYVSKKSGLILDAKAKSEFLEFIDKCSMLSKRTKDGMLQSANGREGVVNCNTMWQPQHLYFTTGEEIKEGDWFIHSDATVPQNNFSDVYVDCKKIIASTDPKLHTNEIVEEDVHMYKKPLPKPSQAFIEKYCKLGGIDEVDVDYTDDELWCYKCNKTEVNCVNNSTNCIGYFEDNNAPKVDSHNTITIHIINKITINNNKYN